MFICTIMHHFARFQISPRDTFFLAFIHGLIFSFFPMKDVSIQVYSLTLVKFLKRHLITTFTHNENNEPIHTVLLKGLLQTFSRKGKKDVD